MKKNKLEGTQWSDISIIPVCYSEGPVHNPNVTIPNPLGTVGIVVFWNGGPIPTSTTVLLPASMWCANPNCQNFHQLFSGS